MKRPANIAPAELQILQYINDHHPVTVGEVAVHFADARDYARTTVLTIMERLRGKGHLTRKKAGGAYKYSPVVQKRELQRRLVRDFIDRALSGSVRPFVAYLAQDADLSPAEVTELQQLLREVSARRKAHGRHQSAPGISEQGAGAVRQSDSDRDRQRADRRRADDHQRDRRMMGD